MRLIRCNRCGAEEETPTPPPTQIFPVLPANPARGWSKVSVVQKASQPEVMGDQQVFDLCVDCREVLLEQFMAGATVAAITQPAGKVTLPHDGILFQDCLLAFDPERGRLICEHDDPARFQKLCVDRAQNVAEGVPEQLVEKVQQIAEDVRTAGYAHSYPQRCSAECSEAHTYDDGCLLKTGMDNPKVYCPVGCVEPVTRQSLASHMYDIHGLTPGTGQYEGQWRLISQQGEDLTEAYSEQDPVREGE